MWIFLKSKLGQALAAIGAAAALLFAVFGAGRRSANRKHKEKSAELQAETLEDLTDVRKKHREEDIEAQAKAARGDRNGLDDSW